MRFLLCSAPHDATESSVNLTITEPRDYWLGLKFRLTFWLFSLIALPSLGLKNAFHRFVISVTNSSDTRLIIILLRVSSNTCRCWNLLLSVRLNCGYTLVINWTRLGFYGAQLKIIFVPEQSLSSVCPAAGTNNLITAARISTTNNLRWLLLFEIFSVKDDFFSIFSIYSSWNICVTANCNIVMSLKFLELKIFDLSNTICSC